VLTSAAACATVVSHLDDELVVSANGHISRDVCRAGDRPQSFYMIGSMGLAGAIGLGLALAQPQRGVVVIDGDGNLLMGLGCLALIAERAPSRFLHVVLDNGCYASTGGQRSISDVVDLAALAAAAGYRHVRSVTDDADLADALRELLAADGPTFLRVRVAAGGEGPGPRVPHAPREIAERVRAAAGAVLT
jgi:thiamine pyrophosphate-dependent acetolactate synthase large subunit-like protein